MKKIIITFPGTKLEPRFPGQLITDGTLLEKLVAGTSGDGLDVVALEPREITFVFENADLLDLEVELLENVPGLEVSPMLFHFYDRYETLDYGEIMKQVAISRRPGTETLEVRRGQAPSTDTQTKERRPYDQELETE